jgi:membrane protease YdiL (CAAX protease family)
MIDTPEQQVEEVKKPFWGFWPTVGFGLVTGIVALIVQGIIAIAFLAANLMNNPDIFTFESINKLAMNGLLISIATIVSAIICVGFIILVIKIRKDATIAHYLGLKPLGWKTILVLLAISIGFIMLASVVGNYAGVSDTSDFQLDMYRTSVWPSLLWIAVVLFAPVFEEVLFRGFLFEGFRHSRIGVIGAIILTTLPWALLHVQYELFHIGTIFVLGIIYGFVRYKTESLWSTLFMHTFNNLAAMIITALQVQGIWTG